MEQNQYNNLVRPKKALGQHFLVDLNIARKMVTSLLGASDHFVYSLKEGEIPLFLSS